MLNVNFTIGRVEEGRLPFSDRPLAPAFCVLANGKDRMGGRLLATALLRFGQW